MAEENWQLQLIRKSLKKKEKLKLLEKHLEVNPSALILDLGCAQGTLSYFLRQQGGRWISTDLDFINLKTSHNLLGKNLIQVNEEILPFKNEAFDWVISLDYLEHLENDQFCLEETHRILKRGGHLLIATPRSGKLFILHGLRRLLGMKLEFYGHKREGYSLNALKMKLETARLDYLRHKSFSGFFTESIELLLNFLYVKFLFPKQQVGLRDGQIRPSTQEEFLSKKKSFKAYSIIYPLLWLITRMDKVFFFQRNYGLIAWAKKPGNQVE
jgi:SAM-dependent methyltransferase